MGVANEDIVYQKARGRARGKPKFFEKSFRRPSARRREARPQCFYAEMRFYL